MLSGDELGMSSKKGKIAITPPISTTFNNGSSNKNDGNFKDTYSPHQTPSPGGNDVNRQFTFLEVRHPEYPEVFTIGNINADGQLNRSIEPQSVNTLTKNKRNVVEEKYKWTERDNDDNVDSGKQKTGMKKSSLCIVIVVAVVMVLLVMASIAVIVAFTVYHVGDTKAQEPSTISPDYLSVDGSLALIQTWTSDLTNLSSPLYISLASNFKTVMDQLLKNSPFVDSYLGTEVIGFSPGSIQVRFLMLFNGQYKLKDPLDTEFADSLQEHLKDHANETSLPINSSTIDIQVRSIKPTSKTPMISTTTTLSSSTVTSTTASTYSTAINFTAALSSSTTSSSISTSSSTGVSNSTATFSSTSNSSSTSAFVTTTVKDNCVPVTFQTCRTRGFMYTIYPNLLNNNNESDAEQAFLLASRTVMNQVCQESALTYLCSLYFPKCVLHTGEQLYPCRSTCEEAVTTCQDYFANAFSCVSFANTSCVSAGTTFAPSTTPVSSVCEVTMQEECRNLGFNFTYFPNYLNEPEQNGSMDTFANYMLPLINGCHDDALFFLCSVQFPWCLGDVRKGPCRRTCKSVVTNCSNLAEYFQCQDFSDIDCAAPEIPTRNCTSYEFTCIHEAKCLRNESICNRINDCGDWADEMDCTCGQYDYQCKMGMCIKSFQRCDNIVDCPDNSDETNCDGCMNGQVKCPKEKCIMSEWLCDGRDDCADGWDEINCDMCNRNEFACFNRKTCVNLTVICDNVSNCPDGSDEWECVNNDNGILQIPYRKYLLPICADSWNSTHGEYTCRNLLGKGSYINSTHVPYNVQTFAKLSANGTVASVLGNIEITNECPSSKAVSINCQNRGCGQRMLENAVSFIVNGEDATPGAWPWHVALYFAGQYFCGGTLISNQFVLTAVHCVDKYINDFSLLSVKLGANNRVKNEATQKILKVGAIIMHPDHVYFEKNDIALLQLIAPVNFTNFIQPICLPEPGDTLPLYSTCFAVGWGKTKWNADFSQILQQLKMTLWDTSKCNSSIAWNGTVYDSFLCAGYYSGVKSICTGDSGGPLACMDKQKIWKIVGVSSYVANLCNMTEKPNIFTNVTKFMPWINENIECKFRCDNGKCLYNKDYLCDRKDHCGDNSDEINICNRTMTCDFDDRYMCGYQLTGWDIGYDNKLSARIDVDGQLHTESTVPQFDHTRGRYPGNFIFGKLKTVANAELTSPFFNTSGQTCIRFSYYLRGSVYLGVTVILNEYNKNNTAYPSTKFMTGKNDNYVDEWKTGYFDISLGRFKVVFRSGDLLKVAIDDVKMLPGFCDAVLCTQEEYRCKGQNLDHCIPMQSRCNLVVDCEDSHDEIGCSAPDGNYNCSFENGNLCALHQNVEDASDWWLVNASFVRDDARIKQFVDHTSGSDSGYLFYINAIFLRSGTHIYMWQSFHLNTSFQHCLTFFHFMRTDVTLYIYVDCSNCTRQTYVARATVDDFWILVQINLPIVDDVKVTYDVAGINKTDSFFYPFLAIDDINVKPGLCPKYVCPENYTKCNFEDRCITLSELCDRNIDCLDESDESNCNCTKDEFKCSSGLCIPISYKCDRIAQCSDNSDEGINCTAFNSVSCTFEHPYMCGYVFAKYTGYTWTRIKGRAPTILMGPEYDHTFGNESGHYMYAKADAGSRGDNTSFISPEFVSGVNSSIEFFYHMYTHTPISKPGVLEFALEDTATKVKSVQWQSDQKLIDIWLHMCSDLPQNITLRIWFTAIRNETTIDGVDMAIDDIKLNPYPCAGV